jgi:PAS domain S-box-containing protein
LKLIPKDIGQVYPDLPGLDLMELSLPLGDELFLEHSSFAYFDISGPVKQVEIKVDIHLKSVLQGVIQATQEGVKAGLLFLSNQKTASNAIIWRWVGQNNSSLIIGLEEFLFALNDLNLLRRTVNESKIGYWRLDFITNAIIWNEQTYHIHEIPVGQKIDLSGAINHYPEGEARDRIQEVIDRAMNENQSWSVDSPFVTAKGKWITVRSQGFPHFEEGKCTAIYGIFQDISDWADQAEEFAGFIEASPTPMAITDTDVRYIAASDSWKKLYGLEGVELKGKSHYEIFPEICEEWKSNHRRCIQGESISRDKDYFAMSDGTEQWLRWSVNPWTTKGGDVGGMVMMVEDITAAEKLNRQNELLLELTQKQNERLKSFANIVSHNLRTHSGNIQNLITASIEDHPEIRDFEAIQLLEVAAQSLSETISNLVDVSTIQNASTVDFEAVDLHKVLKNVVSSIQSLLQAGEVQFDCQIEGDGQVKGIPAFVESILLNILTNGIKYASPKRKSTLRLRAYPENSVYKVEIEDNGLGIDLKKHGDRLFSMYTTFHKHKDARGIGLFVTKNQIESLGGRIEVQSAEGKGSKFIVTFRR